MAKASMKIILLGGGGHAKGVIEAMAAVKMPKPVGLLDPDPELRGGKVLGVPVIGSDEKLGALRKQGVGFFVMGLGGVRDNMPRLKLFESCVRAGLKPLTIVHPDATVSRSARIGAGSVIFAGAVVNSDAAVGINVIVNTGAIIEHDCVVGDHVHISTGACLGGDVAVGDRVHVGMGATVRQGITIGDDAVIGAGAVVVKDVAPALIVTGIPAKPHVEKLA